MQGLSKWSLKPAEELVCLLPLLPDDIFLAFTSRDEPDREHLGPGENGVLPSAPYIYIGPPVASVDYIK